MWVQVIIALRDPRLRVVAVIMADWLSSNTLVIRSNAPMERKVINAFLMAGKFFDLLVRGRATTEVVAAGTMEFAGIQRPVSSVVI